MRKWRKQNPEKIKEYRKRLLEKNPNYDKEQYERHREYELQYKRDHREQIRIQERKWRAKNPEKVRRYYNQHLQNLIKLKREFIEMLGSKCQNPKCGIKATDSNLCIFDFHHINPEEKESKNESRTRGFKQKILDGKIKLLCANCHRLEHEKPRKN